MSIGCFPYVDAETMKYNLVHKLLFVETNLKSIYYLPYAPLLDDLIKGKSRLGVSFFVEKDIKKPKDLRQKFDYFWGRKNAKIIYWEHPLLPGIKGKLLLDMSNDQYSITVNRGYYRLAKYKFENVWPPGQHLTNLVVLKLLQNNILTLHCASFSNKKTKEGYLVFGASNTGKSYTTFAALGEDYQYHSEDLTILDRDFIYTSPLISTQSDMLPKKNLFLKYNLFIRNLVGINTVLPRSHDLSSFRDFFSKEDVKSKSKPSKVFILERGVGAIRKISDSEAFRKVIILNRLELPYYKDHLLHAYSYFNPSLSIRKIRNIEREQIKRVLEKSECFIVRAPSPDVYLTLLKKVIDNS